MAVGLLYVDLFCGAGGTSTGVETAKVHGEKCAKVIACVNHDANAIASHAENHPESLHFTEDIRTLDLTELIAYVKLMRKKYPFAKLVLWASLECTNFSKAKGGLARDGDSRTLAEHLDRYIIALNPDSVQIENVEEFMSWGDLCENGKPISRDKGKSYVRWVDHVKSFGYNYDYRILNSADFGALTSRKRFFAQFNKPQFPTVWPEPTHAKNPVSGLFENFAKWRPVKEVLDFEDEGNSIFGRKKPLVEASLDRIWHGLVKFVAGGKDKWLLKYNSKSKTGVHIPPGVDDPCPTVSCQGRLGLMSAKFLSAYYGNGYVASIDTACNALGTKDTFSINTVRFIDQQFGKSKPASIDSPLGGLTQNPKYASVTANKWHYIMDAQYSRVGNDVDQPCFTLIARMDKTPPYLVEITKDGDLPSFIKIDGNVIVYEIYEADSPMLKKIKEFMAMYGLVDIKMRMLKIPELKQIMGFPKDYVLIGTQADQKKFIGNAVEVTMARKICEASAFRLFEDRFKYTKAA